MNFARQGAESSPSVTPIARVKWDPRPLLITCALVLLSAPIYLLRPFGAFDDSLFLKFGEMVASGSIPYRDFADNKTPGTYYVAAAIHVLSGGHWLGPRIFLMGFTIVFSLLLAAFASAQWGRKSGYWTALLFGVAYPVAQGYSLHTDQLCAFFCFLGVASLFVDKITENKRWVLSGALFTIAFLFKQIAAVSLFATGIWIVAELILRAVSFRVSVRRVLGLTAGMVGVLAVFSLALYLQGNFADAYRAIIVEGVVATKNGFPIDVVVRIYTALQAKNMALWVLAFLVAVRVARKEPLFLYDVQSSVLRLLLIQASIHLFLNLSANATAGHFLHSSLWSLCLVAAFYADCLSPSKWTRAVLAGVGSLTTVYLAGIIWYGIGFMGSKGIWFDLVQRREMRLFFDANLSPEIPVLGISASAARLHYMHGRQPYGKYLFFWWNDRFSLRDAWRMIETGAVPAAFVEVPVEGPLWSVWQEVQQSELPSAIIHYEVFEPPHSLNESRGTRLLLLINRNQLAQSRNP